MKYIVPEYKISILEAKEIISVSTEKPEIENEGEGKGNIIFTVSNLLS